eukprot:TRINITY_DN19086_c0_g1_i1.p1 TRINITY_DN19086_c0_g1~~TRINITY_DN19086_c0_g1_i1.p1  ORF type:complete len:143 (+),score=41.78 TRINITY_DN19086_c0_g1_i1:23-451(+)
MDDSTDESFGVIPIRREAGCCQVFMVQHRYGKHWGFPKGHKDSADETAFEAAKRELREECQFEIKELLVSGREFEEAYSFEKHGTTVQKKVTYWVASVHSEQPVLQESELVDGRWFDFDSAKQMATFEEARDLLNRVSATLN